mmetsp:Transcript_16534/g.31323  ORF Transcript_16534/g.31323 Transcript_16534/m.31323 type:complete len:560 (-) Transcript_16534:110-1789(-)|eukprot:CAMPEP_0176497916 /NCGR_PEP_ID=MMETSP0200_2-20121128/12008_1 /TAXON_ID=947934 /ORGANISM="Chaetoceros sp., Strain GSL56" /LENGTH=559 /DNA_ID=CAMNT_0017896019 /DNA_START=70 /DNA_END=1749 /DNA_ORIENTATION=-
MMFLKTFLLVVLSITSAKAATCGWGSVGDGECEDPNLCCSKWGWCDNTPEHCATFPPTNSPVAAPSPNTVPAPSPIQEDDSRLVAYLGNWQSCPPADKVAKYTHIVISFAVTYTWTPTENICSSTCEIYEPAVCNNEPNPQLISQWQAAGKKVMLSFGGAAMGGSWEGDVNDCWEDCYGRETEVVNRLAEIVNSMGLDGVDIDFEYHVTPTAVSFLNEVTIGLRNALPPGSLVTHAPMDLDLVPGKPYYDNVLSVIGKDLDFLMPQYYNGITRPAIDGIGGTGAGSTSALSHYNQLVDGIYGGDARRVLFGFCIADCGGTGSNVNAQQASQIMTDIAVTYPCNGGAFFWVSEDDQGGSWSFTVGSTIQTLAELNCLTPSPTPYGVCDDDPLFSFTLDNGKLKKCSWLTANDSKTSIRTGKYCVQNDVGAACRLSCSFCSDHPTPSPTSCTDDPTFSFTLDIGKSKKCSWLTANASKTSVRTGNYCVRDDVGKACPLSCNICVPSGCQDDPSFSFFLDNGNQKNCSWLTLNASKTSFRIEKYCANDEIANACHVSCNSCP